MTSEAKTMADDTASAEGLPQPATVEMQNERQTPPNGGQELYVSLPAFCAATT